MIFFISDGRLGNQAFQYAFLNTIAQKGEKVICVNMAQFERYFNYNNVHFVFLSSSKLTLYLYNKVVLKILNFIVNVGVFGCIEQLRINGIPQPEVNKKKGILPFTFVKTGFFQTERLFNKSRVDIHLRQKYLIEAKRVLQKTPMNKRVFVHVRRGDYLSEIFLGEKGINLPKQYYFDAINKIRKNIDNPCFIFLTDDPSYVNDCFNEIENKLVSEECMGTDLAIMSLCQYGIVSNSSFSWWGAYLSPDKKVMVFPKYWYGWKKKVESHVGIQPSWGTVIDVRKASE